MSKVVFFDMDGTLLAQKDPTSIPCMSEYTKEILKEVRKQGHHLFIASGRPYAFLPEEVLEGYFDGFVVLPGCGAGCAVDNRCRIWRRTRAWLPPGPADG